MKNVRFNHRKCRLKLLTTGSTLRNVALAQNVNKLPRRSRQGRNNGFGAVGERTAQFWDVDAGREGGLPYQPWAAEARKAREDERDRETHAGGENNNKGVEPFHAWPARLAAPRLGVDPQEQLGFGRRLLLERVVDVVRAGRDSDLGFCCRVGVAQLYRSRFRLCESHS